MKAINVLLALLVSAVIGAGVLEGGLRLLGLGPPKTLMQFDPVLGWAKKPNCELSRSTGEFEVDFALNELGLRDDPMADPAKPAGTFRVLMLGDSFTLGFAVDRADLFVDQLERWWRAEGRAIDVINAGTEGYSTDQAILWLAERGKDFQPDLVLLFPYDNDLYWNGETDYMGRAKPRYASDGTLETRLLEDTADTSWKSRFALTRPLREKPDVRGHLFKPGSATIEKEHAALLLAKPEFLAAAEACTQGGFTALKRAAGELGARALVVPIPSHAAIDESYAPVLGKRLGLARGAWDPNKPVDTMIALARQAGLETLDPRPGLAAARRDGRELYNRIDWHLNAEGNAAFAAFLHAELDRLELFPGPHAAPSGERLALPEIEHAPAGVPGWLKLYGVLWLALTALYYGHYRDEPQWQPPLKVAAMLAAVFGIVLGGNQLVALLPAKFAQPILIVFVLGILGFVLYKVGRRAGTICELLAAFVLRGHWYLMPLIVVLLTIGSLLVVAASSPLVAPFIYTLF